jgi:hypothetical protein
MTRTWISKVSGTLTTARTGSTRRRRTRTALRLENLEDRLSLSSMNSGSIVVPQSQPPDPCVAGNPQMLAPGRSFDLNPQPLPPGFTFYLNPQPLPPGRA